MYRSRLRSRARSRRRVVRAAAALLAVASMTHAPFASAAVGDAQSPQQGKNQQVGQCGSSGTAPAKGTAPSTQNPGGLPTQCTSGLLSYLVKIPNFADPASAGSGNLNRLESYDAALAGGSVGAVLTLAAIGYLTGLLPGGAGQ